MIEAIATTPTAENRTVMAIASLAGDISGLFSEAEIAAIGADAVRDYEMDLASRAVWAAKAKTALDAATQEVEREAKDYPFPGASDVKYPILTVAAMQFQARAYPAIVKGDEVVQIKIVGSDKGRAATGPDGAPLADIDGSQKWVRAPGGKAKRAARVRDYMNVCVMHRMDGWEADTDLLLLQLPIVGCGFRKVWWDARKGKPCAAFVPALRLVVSNDAKSLATAPRITEEIPDIFPFQIRSKIRQGFYRAADLPPSGEDSESPRLLIEQQRYIDADGDGLDEPYIVTVDVQTRQVLRIEANFGPDDLDGDPETGRIDSIDPGTFYVGYTFIPNPDGHFYGIGFGHLLAEIMPVIDTAINQMIDAGHAQIAGGGFISGGLRLQGNGQSANLRWRPGEYKMVSVSGAALRDAIYERPMPPPGTVLFSLLELMLGAARDIAAIKDVTSGDASNNGQVGTTLALIEQGLQVFTAIYKRVYLGLRKEFGLLFDKMGAHGDAHTAADYDMVLDDPEADFAADFSSSDMDIRPISDPQSVTRMQKMARAQFLAGLRGTGFDDAEINRRILEAADIEDIDLLLPAKPNGPPPQLLAEMAKLESETEKNKAAADLDRAKVAQIATEIGRTLGEADAEEPGADLGRVPSMAGAPADAMGVPGNAGGGAGPAGGLAGPVMGDGALRPVGAL